MANPRTKSPLASRTIWSALLAITAGLPDVLRAIGYVAGFTDEPVSPDQLSYALMSIVGGVGAIWGRITASTTIERHTL